MPRYSPGKAGLRLNLTGKVGGSERWRDICQGQIVEGLRLPVKTGGARGTGHSPWKAGYGFDLPCNTAGASVAGQLVRERLDKVYS